MRQTDAQFFSLTFLVRIQVPSCSPSTIPRRPSSATIGGAGLFTRITPYKMPTNKPTANEMSSTFISCSPVHFQAMLLSGCALERETVTAETPKPGFSEYTDVPIWALLRLTRL